jgi:hypothetical protein
MIRTGFGKKRSTILIAAMLILAAIFVIAADTAPYFTPAPPSPITCYQNSTCFYDFNATDDESDPYNFSIDTPPFSQNIDADTGILNFTPTNAQVGTYSNTWAIVKELDTGNGSFALITWIVVNINDAPYFTSYYPQNLTNLSVKENYWQKFNATADDLDLIHGDNITYTWMIDGLVNKTLLNYTNITANYTPDFFSSGTHNITCLIYDNQTTFRQIDWAVNVTNENRAPVNNESIGNITLQEDTMGTNLLNLSRYFYDNDTDDYPLSYDIVFISGSDLTAYINATEPHNASLMPDYNFFGSNTIQFRCYDGYNYTTSNSVTVNVTGVNDPPNVTQVENQTAYVSVLWQLQVQRTDPDTDPMTCYDNTTLFNINPSSCFISQTFGVGNIGNYSIRIDVDDGTVNTTMIFNLSVINNTAPVLTGTPFADIYTTEGNFTYAQYNATDIDLDDELNFSSTSIPSNAKLVLVTTNSSPLGASSYLSFTPDQTDVGSWQFTVRARDSKGATDDDTLTIDITDIEHAPDLLPIQNQRMKVNLSFSMYVYANDDDGNVDSFYENTTLFDISRGGSGYNATGFIQFTPNDSDVGAHVINISVNDTASNSEFQLVVFNVTLNTPPTITPILNQTALEDLRFEYQVDATDPDPQDTLTYYDNTTIFNISNTTGLISFIPTVNDTGDHAINITVGDGFENSSILLNLTIGDYDDFPIWIPPLDEYYTNESYYLNTTSWTSSILLDYSTNMTVWNSTLYEGNLTRIYLDAFDEETATLTFSVLHINFTNASNDTITSGIQLINLTSYDGDTALANFTANNSQVGIYYVNFTADDGTGRENISTVRLEIFNVNDAPIILNHTPNVTYYLNMTENSSLMFNVNAIDIDYESALHYQWAVDGDNITGANESYYNYTTHFLSAGWRNLTIFVLDESNLSTMVNWTINVTNVNRMGWFGQLRQHNYTHWNAGVTKTNITLLQEEEGVILGFAGLGFYPSGLFESQVLDTYETNYFHEFNTINWTGNTTPPANVGFDIFFQTRVSPGLTQISCPSTISQPYNGSYTVSNLLINNTVDRCIQYRFVIATNDTTETPSIDSVTLGFRIAGKEQEQNTNQSWVDLDTYFHEPDSDDTISYNVTDPNGSIITDINVSIDSFTHKAFILAGDQFVGSVDLVFSMYDGYNYTYSNIVTVNITEIPPQVQPIIIPVGGGGSVSNPVPYEVPKYVDTPVSFRLITPQMVTTYANNTMEVPINIFNSNYTMNKLRLKAATPNKDVVLRLSRDRFETLKPNEKQYLTLYVDSYKTYGTYEILIEATAEAVSTAQDGTEKISEFKEKAKIFVNSLLKGEDNETQVNTKLAFAEDLLSTNPECLELNEFLKKASDLIKENEAGAAGKMLDQVVESCKYLLAPREVKPEIEEPIKVYGMPTESMFILVTVSLITLIVAIALIIGWSHLKSKKKEIMRRREI